MDTLVVGGLYQVSGVLTSRQICIFEGIVPPVNRSITSVWKKLES